MKKLRYFLEVSLLESAAWILPRLPRPVLLGFARLIGTIAFYVDKRGRNTALENLRAAFGKLYDEPQRRRIAKGSYQTFARTFFDLFWSSKLTKDNWQDYFDVFIPEPEIEEQARQTGGVWVTPHFGNFEMVSQVWGFRGFPFTVVAQDFKNPAVTRVFKRLREQSGHTLIPQDGAMIKLIKTLKRKGHAGMLTDLNIVPGKSAAAIQCFGLWTCVPTLHVELAKRLGLSIITGVCRPLPKGRYEARLFEAFQPKPEDDTRELTQRVWDDFEGSIREHPECWLWMYKHWRYRPTDDVTWIDKRYPSYSNAYEAFMDMVPEPLRPQRSAED